MKRIIAFLLAIMMLPIFSLVSHAAGTVPTMSEQEFKEVLLGQFTDPDPDVNYGADLIRAYRNISKDQLDVMRAYYDYNTTPVASPLPSNPPVITQDEADILTYGFIKLMTFPDIKANLFNGSEVITSTNDIYSDDTVFDGSSASINDDIDRAVAAFYTEFTIPGNIDPVTPADILNKVSGETMTKDALGAFVIELQKNLRDVAEDNINGFLNAFIEEPAEDYVDAIIPYVKTAAAMALTNPAGDELGVAKTAMLGNGMLVLDGSDVSEDSAFIDLIVHAINTLKNDSAHNGAVVAATVMNTVMSGVMDAKVEVYSDAAGTTKTATVEPNNLVVEFYVGDTVYLKVISDELAKLFERGEEDSLTFNLSLSASLDAGNDGGLVTVTRESNGLLKVTGATAGTGILKLYRDTNNNFEGNVTNNVKELFMELDIKVNTRPSSPQGGGGPVSRVEAPTITYEVDADNNITVTLETKTSGATIYYTTDGSTPTKKSEKYEGPFQVEDGTTIKAYAVKSGWLDSYVTTDTIDLESGKIPSFTEEHIAYVHGRDTGNFDADDNVTRAEVTAMFSRLIVKKMVFTDSSESMFSDVNEGDWYTAYVKYLSNVGIVNGYEDGTFHPNSPITRAEFATIASRFFALEASEGDTFPDVAADHWAKAYIDSAVVKGWLVGYEDGTFRPDQPIKRSEAVTIINRMLNREADKEYIAANYDDVLTYPDLSESHWAYYEILEASNWHDHKVENNVETWIDIFYEERFLAS